MHMRNRRHISDLLVRSVQNEIGVPRASACGLDCLGDTFLIKMYGCGIVKTKRSCRKACGLCEYSEYDNIHRHLTIYYIYKV